MRTLKLLIRAFASALLVGAASAAAQPLDIKIAAATATNHAPIFIGVERGIFAKHGLNAKVDLFPTGVEIINAVVAGNSDVGTLGATPVLTGIANGMPLAIIGHLHGDASKAFYSEANSIVAGGKSGVTAANLKALKGKKVGLPRGTDAESLLRGTLEQSGLTLADVTLVNLRPADLPTALRNGDVDLVAGWEPWATISSLKVPGATRVVWGKCQSCYDPGTIVTTRKIAADKAEALRRFMLAFAESLQWLRQNQQDAADLATRWVPGVEPDVMREAIKYSVYDPRLSQNTIKGFNGKSIPALVEAKRIPKSFDIASGLDKQFSLYADQNGARFFSDLAPIADADKLK